jgi:GT2 family glycosyltransferase
MNEPVKIAVSLVLHDEEQHIPRLAEALNDQTVKPCCIYVTDNNSRDDSPVLLKELLPSAYIHLSGKNPGFGTAHNNNMKKAFAVGADAVLILNTDTRPDSKLTGILAEHLSSHPDEGVIAPLILYGESSTIQSYRQRADLKKGKIKNIDEGKDLNTSDLPGHERVNYFSGTACLITKRAFDTTGGFTEDNFLYGEEMDYSYRAYQKEIKITALKSAIVRHFHEWSKKNIEGLCRDYYHINRNRIRYFRKFKLKKGLFLFIAGEILISPLRIRWALKTGGKKLVHCYYLGIIHGLKNRTKLPDILKNKNS